MGVLLPLLLLCARADAAEADVVQAATRIIEARMPGRADPDALRLAALQGMASWLDAQAGAPGNAVLTVAEDRARQARLRGERTGMGVEYTVATGRGLLVTEVFPGSPAAGAALLAGDLVVAVDDHPFTGLAAPAIQQLVDARVLAGRGRGVVLDVRREEGPLRRLELRPGTFVVPPARVTTDDARLVLRLDVLGPGTPAVVSQALAQAGGRLVVLDLRDVREGTLAAVAGLAGAFLGPDQPVARTVDPSGRVDAVKSTGERAHAGRIAVLVNRGTAGPAEALAAALRDQGRAAVVGTRTAGHAALESHHPLGDGLVLQLADTMLLAADGTSWAAGGVQPDLVVEPVQVPLVGPLRTGFPDIQLEAAHRFLVAP
ncbi:S41 family peptidase [Myxococcota bacterium]|nr:S41 family peptidase [Myxococcota bacterium]